MRLRSLPQMAPVLLIKHLPDLAHARGVLRLLVRGSKGDYAGESQRESWLIADLAGCMAWARRDLVGQDLHHDLRSQPHVGDENRVHPSRLLADLETVSLLVELPPSLVGKAGAELADG